MEQVFSVTVTGTAATACAGGMALEGFLAKADGDTALEALIFQNLDSQARLGRLGVLQHSRLAREAREQRLRALQRLQEASRKSSFWGKLGKVLKAVFGATTAVLGVLSLAGAASGVGLAGAVICGAIKVTQSRYDARAGRAKADRLEQQARAASETTAGETCREFLEQAVQVENTMVSHLRQLCDREVHTPAYTGGGRHD